uniref:Uncharacterized protein n=1 Tax=Anguilla anguilla TaxID=7936 RepID=A0A0E9VA13_ANGAN
MSATRELVLDLFGRPL